MKPLYSGTFSLYLRSLTMFIIIYFGALIITKLSGILEVLMHDDIAAASSPAKYRTQPIRILFFLFLSLFYFIFFLYFALAF